jgi:7,8-dihydropterin-6-yl-methyl-4-(beta-D-ribofuranosyl)aminobenzene 5'-phosphate synthase
VRVRVIVENSTLIDRYLRGEPALALLVEDGGTKILFDTGYSDLLIANAAALGVSLLDLTHVVLSHGHVDHTGGLEPLMRHWTTEALEGRPWRRPVFVAHPLAFAGRSRSVGETGTRVAPEVLGRYGEVRLADEPLRLSDRVLFLGEVGERLLHERPAPGADPFPDDTGLALEAADGLVILSGCAHAGICSIVSQAQRLTGEERIRDVIGGFHLLGPSEERLAATVSFFATLAPAAVHPCHCTDFGTRCALARAVPVGEVGVGLVLDYD